MRSMSIYGRFLSEQGNDPLFSVGNVKYDFAIIRKIENPIASYKASAVLTYRGGSVIILLYLYGKL